MSDILNWLGKPEVQRGLLQTGQLLFDEVRASLQGPDARSDRTKFRKEDDGLHLDGRYADAVVSPPPEGKVTKFYDRRTGETYTPVPGKTNEWTVTGGPNREWHREWHGTIKLNSGGEIIKEKKDKSTREVYRANGDVETTYQDQEGKTIGSMKLTARGDKTYTVDGQTFAVPSNNGRRTAEPGARDARVNPPVPARPGHDTPTPPGQPQPGDQPFPPHPARRPDVAQPRAPEHPAQPRLDEVIRNFLTQIVPQLMEAAKRLGQDVHPPIAPPGLDGRRPLHLLPRQAGDDPDVVKYTDNPNAPTFLASEKITNGQIVKRTVFYTTPKTVEFQPQEGRPPIKLENVRRSVSELKDGKFVTTVTCETPNGPVNHKFVTGPDGRVVESPLGSLPPEHFRTWSKDNVKSLRLEDITKLTPAQVKELPVPVVQVLSATQLSKFSDDQLRALTQPQLKELSAVQLKELTPQQIETLVGSQNASDEIKTTLRQKAIVSRIPLVIPLGIPF